MAFLSATEFIAAGLLIYLVISLHTTCTRASSLNLAQSKMATPGRPASPTNQNEALASLSAPVEKLAEIGGGLYIRDVTFSSDKKKIFALIAGRSIIWDPFRSEGMRVVPCKMIIGKGDLCISQKSRSGGMKVIETEAGKEVYLLSKGSTDVVVSPLGSYLSVKNISNSVDLFKAKDGAQIARLSSSWGFENILYSEDESLLAANDAEKFVVYDLKRRTALKVSSSRVRSFAISSKGTYLWAASYYAAPQVLNANGKLESRKLPEDLSSRYADSVFGAFMDSDSKVVMKTYLGDVGVWDWKSNKITEIPTKAEHLSVAENGLLTLTKEGIAQLWDRNMRKVFTFKKPMSRGIMTGDGTHVVTVTRDGTLAMWNVRM